MRPSINESESKFLERVRTALTNASGNQVIKSALANFGFGDAEHAAGQKKYEGTLAVWENNKKEDAETVTAATEYKAQYSAVAAALKRNRDLVRKYFRNQPGYLVELGVQGTFPSKYNELFDSASRFYLGILSNNAILQQLTRIHIGAEVADAQMKALSDLKTMRSKLDSETAESQDATKTKDAALIEMKEWLDDFYALAQIALYDQPQLLEALGMFVRS